MKKEMANRLVAALRSGDYEQGTGSLNDNGKFCCLGVACDIVKDELGLKVNDEGKLYKRVTYDDQGGYLPEKVVEYFGFNNRHGGLMNRGIFTIGDFEYNGLAEANDSGRNFEQIATVIEQNWERL